MADLTPEQQAQFNRAMRRIRMLLRLKKRLQEQQAERASRPTLLRRQV